MPKRKNKKNYANENQNNGNSNLRRNKGHSSRKAPNNNENFESYSITKIRRKTSKL